MRPNGGRGRGRGRGRGLERSASELAEEEEISKIHERHLRGTFGKESIKNLANTLYEETSHEEEEKKLAYFFTRPMNALIVDMKNPKEARAMEMPSELKNLTSFGCTVWNKTKIIIAGGENEDEDSYNKLLFKDVSDMFKFPSDKVFIFDTVSRTWAPPSRMRRKRGVQPTLVVADGRLFVFGGKPDTEYPDEYKTLDDSDMTHLDDYDPNTMWQFNLPRDPRCLAAYKKHFVEFCCNVDDTTTSWSWDYLQPSHRFPVGHWGTPLFCAHAVYPKKNLILFHDSCCKSVLSFDYKTGKWEKFKKHMPINHYFHWSNNVVVLQDFLFWHFHGTIYAHDLLDNTTYPVYELPNPKLYPNTPTFLVRAGKNTLCLFCSVHVDSVWYWTFLVDIAKGRGSGFLVLTLDQHGILDTPIPVTEIDHLLECSA